MQDNAAGDAAPGKGCDQTKAGIAAPSSLF